MVAPSKETIGRWTFGSAYAAIALLIATLAIGPVNVVCGRHQPISSDSRRDTGIWAAIWSLFHTVGGLQVHLRGRMWEYFFQSGSQPLFTRIRQDMFGFANYSGLLAALFITLLAAISNDWSLQLLGARRWKRVQQLNYVLFAVVVVHAILYQIIEKRTPPFAFTIGFLTAAAMVLQIAKAINRAGATNLSE